MSEWTIGKEKGIKNFCQTRGQMLLIKCFHLRCERKDVNNQNCSDFGRQFSGCLIFKVVSNKIKFPSVRRQNDSRLGRDFIHKKL